MTDLKATVADLICHSDQLIIWTNELLTTIEEYLNESLYYDDLADLHNAVQAEIKQTVVSALSHPELSAPETSEQINALQADT